MGFSFPEYFKHSEMKNFELRHYIVNVLRHTLSTTSYRISGDAKTFCSGGSIWGHWFIRIDRPNKSVMQRESKLRRMVIIRTGKKNQKKKPLLSIIQTNFKITFILYITLIMKFWIFICLVVFVIKKIISSA